MLARKRLLYWIIPAVIVGMGMLLQSCGDDDGDEFCADVEIVADEALCEAYAVDNFCESFDFTPPDNCEVSGCDCVIIDDDVFDD